MLPKPFPKRHDIHLIDQIRRSSRSTNICTVEAYRKRRYPNHFISKLTDVDMENSETQGWLEFALACNYINQDIFSKLTGQSEEVGKLVNFMINNPDRFGAISA
jgi:four helix bundle protein